MDLGLLMSTCILGTGIMDTEKDVHCRYNLGALRAGAMGGGVIALTAGGGHAGSLYPEKEEKDFTSGGSQQFLDNWQGYFNGETLDFLSIGQAEF